MNIELGPYIIFFGFPDKGDLNNVISQIAYTIHKYWIILKNENKNYVKQVLKNMIKSDLTYKAKIFQMIKENSICELYHNLASNML